MARLSDSGAITSSSGASSGDWHGRAGSDPAMSTQTSDGNASSSPDSVQMQGDADGAVGSSRCLQVAAQPEGLARSPSSASITSDACSAADPDDEFVAGPSGACI